MEWCGFKLVLTDNGPFYLVSGNPTPTIQQYIGEPTFSKCDKIIISLPF